MRFIGRVENMGRVVEFIQIAIGLRQRPAPSKLSPASRITGARRRAPVSKPRLHRTGSYHAIAYAVYDPRPGHKGDFLMASLARRFPGATLHTWGGRAGPRSGQAPVV